MANLAIIPARGGSKRIPRKNIKEFLGKPIITYSIEVALRSELFDEVMVSTDDKEIANIAVKYGAKVPFMRSSKASDDFATTFEVISEVIQEYKNKNRRKFDYICCIYPATPLIKKHQLIKGEQLIKISDFDIVFPVIPFTHPIWRGMELNDSGELNYLWAENERKRTQDFKTVYHDAGQWYWIKCSSFQKESGIRKKGALVLSPDEAQDIDTFTDWKLAELKYKIQSEK